MSVNTGELVIIVLIAVLLLGPDRLPEYAQGLARLIRRGRDFARGAREQVRSEMGPEFDDIDWKRYDPRRYHPRTIVRNALSEAWEDDADEPAAGQPARPRRPSRRTGSSAARGSAQPDGVAGGRSATGRGRAARSPRPPAVRDVQRPSPPPASWDSVAREGAAHDADAT